MAISRKTQKDVGKFKAKFIGPFTLKQLLFIGSGIIFCVLFWFIADSLQMQTTDKIPIIFIIMIPFIALGFINPYGMTMAQFIKTYYENRILCPKVRKYVIETDIDLIEQKKEQPKTINKHKSDPQYPDYL